VVILPVDQGLKHGPDPFVGPNRTLTIALSLQLEIRGHQR